MKAYYEVITVPNSFFPKITLFVWSEEDCADLKAAHDVKEVRDRDHFDWLLNYVRGSNRGAAPIITPHQLTLPLKVQLAKGWYFISTPPQTGIQLVPYMKAYTT